MFILITYHKYRKIANNYAFIASSDDKNYLKSIKNNLENKNKYHFMKYKIITKNYYIKLYKENLKVSLY